MNEFGQRCGTVAAYGLLWLAACGVSLSALAQTGIGGFRLKTADKEQKPVITSISPSGCVSPGQTIDIRGQHFGKNQQYGVMLLAKSESLRLQHFKSWSDRHIRATLPSDLQPTNYTIGLTYAGVWQSNRDQSLRVCQDKSAAASEDARRVLPTDTRREGFDLEPEPEAVVTEYPDSNVPRKAFSSQGYTAPPFPQIPGSDRQAKALLREVVDRELLVVSLSLDAANVLAGQAKALGLKLRRRQVLDTLGLVMTTLAVPLSVDLGDAMRSLKSELPEVWTDYNHRYTLLDQPLLSRSVDSGGDPKIWLYQAIAWTDAHRSCGNPATTNRAFRLGVIDTGIAALASLPESQIHRKSFLVAGNSPAKKDHASAIAGLLMADIPETGGGLLPHISLYSAEIFKQDKKGRNETSAEYIIHAMDWMHSMNIPVVNLSFGGQQNHLLELVLSQLARQGMTFVAAVGTDKKNRPLFPAQSNTVIAVDGVDVAGKRLNRPGKHPLKTDLLAPGTDLWLMDAAGQYRYRSGSSFAAPIVAALLALGEAEGIAVDTVLKYLQGEPAFGQLWRASTACRFSPVIPLTN